MKYHCLFEKTTKKKKNVPSVSEIVVDNLTKLQSDSHASTRFFYIVMAIGVESHSGEIIFGYRVEVPRLNSSDFVNHSYDYRSNNLIGLDTVLLPLLISITQLVD